ncbi:hypothetical protein KSP39_PZI002746 [Platanthera zijinensis]|uniref:J domain-containing protein n=1 Tax=Platanthera zijinensis TaxID=2320716 RepID=A0AAP0BZ98_9ASPA
MECNKEEAIRAKDIAEMKMKGRDFDGAKKLLLKALRLFPDIDNGSHMLTVCEVHCSGLSLVNGQKDHYGVLQVEPLADESSIRKQYRKLALLLHPDKNKFAGAEAAFKLVGEAYKVLSDKTSRIVYDAKRQVHIRTMPTLKPQNSRNVGINTMHSSQYQYVGKQSSDFFGSQYFWSVCVHCNNLFQYPRSLLNREVQCQRCLKKVHAFEVTPQNVPPSSDSGISCNQTGFQHTEDFSHNKWSYTNFCSPSVTARHPAASKHSKSVYGSTNKVEKTETGEKPATKTSSTVARRMRTAVSSNSAGSTQNGSAGGANVHPTILKDGPMSGRKPRRTARDKPNVTYKEDESDDDFASPSKRSRKSGSYNKKSQNISSSEILTNGLKKTSENPNGKQINDDQGKDKLPGSNAKSAVDPRSKTENESSFSYPDPEFNNFDTYRDQSKFAVNQIWAVYDDDDGMPRYYALIQKVFAPGFKLKYTWLEYNPTSLAEKSWAKAQLPAACGNFKTGKVCSTTCQLMFSHLVFGERGRGSTYDIFPKRGEIWALFSEWDMQWSSAEQIPKKYAYEFVEILSEYVPGQDFTVNHLVKVEGFLYLFARALEKGTSVVLSEHFLKFSHQIPFFRVSVERDGIPPDSFELDPAALPQNAESDAGSAHTDDVASVKSGHPCPPTQADDDIVKDDVIRRTKLRPTQNDLDIPTRSTEDPSSIEQESTNFEFFDFQEGRLKEKFKPGQIWALYSEINEYPNYYAWVKKAEWEKCGLSMKWLKFSPQNENEKSWLKNGLPIGCGRFKLLPQVNQFDSTNAFSHMVHATCILPSNLYEIRPSAGEVWAIFSNWSITWTCRDVGADTDYGLVEVIELDKSAINVLPLTKVEGYRYVFMPEFRTVAIPIHECLRFSHQIPAFRLTNQESGKLKDCWELDPDSIPKILLTPAS